LPENAPTRRFERGVHVRARVAQHEASAARDALVERALGRDLRVARPEAEPHVHDAEAAGARGLEHARGRLQDALRARDHADDALLAVEREDDGRLGVEVAERRHGAGRPGAACLKLPRRNS
jgi:hypothetical protein